MLQIIADNLGFPEAPRWHSNRLWFSDFYDREVKSVSPSGDIRVELKIEDQPSGLGWRPDGSLLVVSMKRRLVLSHRGNGQTQRWADLNHIATFHCNDMIVDDKGGAYVGNFGFDLDAALAARGPERVFADHATAKLAYISPDGNARVVAEDLHFPNGAVITPDDKTLIIAETLAGALTAFDIEADGSLSNRRVWASTLPRMPDGIALDADNGIWIANPLASECVRIGEGGEVLNVITTDRPCFACALGGEDGHMLFMLTAEAGGSSARRGRIWATRVDHGRAA